MRAGIFYFRELIRSFKLLEKFALEQADFSVSVRG
jgi:hypothetical protein